MDKVIGLLEDSEAIIQQTRDMGDHGRTALVLDPTGAPFALFEKASSPGPDVH